MIATNHPQTPAMESVLVDRNRALVNSVARRYKSSLTMEDLFTEGVCGLLIAARKFDKAKGCKFSTVAVSWIRSKIGKAVEASGTVRLPSHCHESIRQLEQCYAAIGRDASNEDICLYLRWTPSKLDRVRQSFKARTVLELDAPVGRNSKGDEQSALVDFQAATGADPAETVLEQIESEKVWGLLAHLPTRQAQIIECRMQGDTLEEVGEKLGISKERVRQIERSGMCTLWRMGKRMEKSEVFP